MKHHFEVKKWLKIMVFQWETRQKIVFSGDIAIIL